jgi:hypothetical protein
MIVASRWDLQLSKDSKYEKCIEQKDNIKSDPI